MIAILGYLGVIGTWAIHRIPLISLELGVFALLIMLLLRLRFLRPARIRKWFWLMVLAKPVAMLIIISPLALNVAMFQDVHTLPQITLDPVLSQSNVGVSGELPLPASRPPNTRVALPHPSFWSRVRGSLGWSHGLAILWISGLTFLCARALMGYRKLSKLRQEAVPLGCSHDVLVSLESSPGIRRLPEVRVSAEASSPLLFGVFRPVILLPSGLHERLAPEALRLILLHELFHWKHRDTWMLLFKSILEALFFFHPAVWYAGRMVVRASEQACDDAVVSFTGNSASYASCLLSISENAGNQRSYALAGLAVRDSAVGQRIKRILKEGFPMISRKAVLVSLSVLILVSVLGLPTFLISKSGDRVSASSLSILGGIELVRFAGAQAPKKAQITFSFDRDGDFEIYVMDVDGKNQRNLTNNPACDADASWSPDGQSIAFYSNRDGNIEIYVMDVDGKNQRNLTNNPATDAGASWSPDGRSIAFHSTRDGNAVIYVMDADGKNPRRLANDGAIWPVWSPDGRSIAFFSQRLGNLDIYVMDADGKNERRLTNHPALDYCPSWSPDSQSVAFTTDRDGQLEIYVMDADGKNQRNLTNSPNASDDEASWSPDGQSIAFGSYRDNSNWEIYIMDTDGKNQRNLTKSATHEWAPEWFDPAFAYSTSPAGKLKATWGKIKRGLFSR